MLKKISKLFTEGRDRSGSPSSTHVCDGGWRCLGPMAFHTGSVGTQISLSLEARRAERARGTFQNGVGFSSRPVRVGEKIRLRVEICDQHWTGALRLGFTTVPPTPDHPPAAMAIPHMTDMPGHWVKIVPEWHARLGSELRFWVDSKGRMVLKGSDKRRHVLQKGVNCKKKLWAVIDVYGQTRAVLLLGSEKGTFRKKRSCPTLPPPPVSQKDSCLCVSKGRPCRARRASLLEPPIGLQLEDCCVCLSEGGACATLPCGHQCLCVPCATRVAKEFGRCPLCRHPIIGPCDMRKG